MKCVPKKTMAQECVQESDIVEKEVKTPAARFGSVKQAGGRGIPGRSADPIADTYVQASLKDRFPEHAPRPGSTS